MANRVGSPRLSGIVSTVVSLKIVAVIWRTVDNNA